MRFDDADQVGRDSLVLEPLARDRLHAQIPPEKTFMAGRPRRPPPQRHFRRPGQADPA
jgi:hypothetical protein